MIKKYMTVAVIVAMGLMVGFVEAIDKPHKPHEKFSKLLKALKNSKHFKDNEQLESIVCVRQILESLGNSRINEFGFILKKVTQDAILKDLTRYLQSDLKVDLDN